MITILKGYSHSNPPNETQQQLSIFDREIFVKREMIAAKILTKIF